VIWLLLGCPKAPPAPAAVDAGPSRLERDWKSPLQREHPLVGLVWQVGEVAPASFDALLADAAQARWVFVGEKHDNVDHHLLQAEVVAAVHPTAVVFEHLDHEDPVGTATTAAEVRDAARWDESGWPPFAEYAPIFDAVFAAGARVVPGHPTRAEVKTAMNEGFDALPAEATADLPLADGLPPDLRAGLAAEIVESHCGMADDALVEKMLRAQLLKDTTLARAMRTAGDPGPTVLIAGNGHTRADRGVPHWLDDRGDHAMTTIAFVEVTPGATDPTLIDPEGADWLVFTPRHDEDDPCAAFRK
jgi:uncharacterized iron-regulated protein